MMTFDFWNNLFPNVHYHLNKNDLTLVLTTIRREARQAFPYDLTKMSEAIKLKHNVALMYTAVAEKKNDYNFVRFWLDAITDNFGKQLFNIAYDYHRNRMPEGEASKMAIEIRNVFLRGCK
jgi:hypothetical protein